MTPQKLPRRQPDNWGQGHFGAKRGGRKHKGVDLIAKPGIEIGAPVTGLVTKIGYPYADHDKSHIRYVQISRDGYDFRVFYVKPCVSIGDKVSLGDLIGTAQDLNPFYSGITPHIHLEIKRNGGYVDPTPLFLVS